MKKILIYNPFSKTGHLDSWLYLIIKAFQKSPYEIHVISPSADVLENNEFDKDKIEVLNLKRFKISGKRLWVYFTFFEFINRLIRIRMRSWEELLKNWSVTHFRQVCKMCAWGLLQPFPLKLFSFFFNLEQLEKLSPTKIFVENVGNAARHERYDHVFITYLDYFLPTQFFWKMFDEEFSVNKSAIKFDTHDCSGHGFLTSPRAGTLFLLDPRIVRDLHSKKLPAFLLPDVCNKETFSSLSETGSEIRSKSNGRKIVFLGGAIGKQKNLSLWLSLVESVNPEEWFFLQAGKVNRSSVSYEEQKKLDTLSRRENFHVIDQYFDDERQFNELISLCDIIFAVYKNFNLSSNMISKAIFFRKKIIVSRDTLMSEHVSKYGLGFSIDENSLDEAVTALCDSSQFSLTENQYSQIEKDFSFEKFQECLLSAFT